MRDFANYDNDVANTWKFRTVAFVLLAAAIPCWPVTAPIFLVFAWLSYKAGMPATAVRSNVGRKRSLAKSLMLTALTAIVLMPLTLILPADLIGVAPILLVTCFFAWYFGKTYDGRNNVPTKSFWSKIFWNAILFDSDKDHGSMKLNYNGDITTGSYFDDGAV